MNTLEKKIDFIFNNREILKKINNPIFLKKYNNSRAEIELFYSNSVINANLKIMKSMIPNYNEMYYKQIKNNSSYETYNKYLEMEGDDYINFDNNKLFFPTNETIEYLKKYIGIDKIDNNIYIIDIYIKDIDTNIIIILSTNRKKSNYIVIKNNIDFTERNKIKIIDNLLTC